MLNYYSRLDTLSNICIKYDHTVSDLYPSACSACSVSHADSQAWNAEKLQELVLQLCQVYMFSGQVDIGDQTGDMSKCCKQGYMKPEHVPAMSQ